MIINRTSAFYHHYTQDSNHVLDIAVRKRREPAGLLPMRSENSSTDPLLFPLLFPRGDSGYDQALPHERAPLDSAPRAYVSPREFYAHRLQDRPKQPGAVLLMNGRRLLQEYIVLSYCKVEASRLRWQLHNQAQLRAIQWQGLADVLKETDWAEAADVGKPIMLGSSFVGGPRYMLEAYMDGMAIVRVHGGADLFLTMTCNPK